MFSKKSGFLANPFFGPSPIKPISSPINPRWEYGTLNVVYGINSQYTRFGGRYVSTLCLSIFQFVL